MPRRFNYAVKMEELRSERGNACEACGVSQAEAKLRYPNGLEFAHLVTTTVNGRGRGLPQRYHDIRNHPEAYALLCRDCHMQQEGRRPPRLPEEVPF